MSALKYNYHCEILRDQYHIINEKGEIDRRKGLAFGIPNENMKYAGGKIEFIVKSMKC